MAANYNGFMFGKKSLGVPEPEDQVRLKPVLGMRPGVYIFIAGILVLALALFFILLYPGIARPGAVVVFTSDPSGAALRVDDIYAGTSPCKVFVPKGNHDMEAVLPGFQPERMECAIPGRLFASVLFPRHYVFDVRLHTVDPIAVLATAAHDYASWTFGGEPTVDWQIPLSLSDGIYRVGTSAASANDVLAAAARFAVTRAALRDLIRAKMLVPGGGVPPSPLGIVQSVSEIMAYLDRNHGSAAWLADILSDELSIELISSAWYQNQLAAFAGITAGEALASQPGEKLPSGQIRVNGLLFTGLESGTLVQGNPFPYAVPVDEFLICTTEVPAPAFADFLDANPQWKPEFKAVLADQGLVTSDYLVDFGANILGTRRTGTGIHAVSWFAANAFCEWLGGKLPESFNGWEIRLPTEAEWEYAAKSMQKQGSNYTVYVQDSGTWVWCADPYSPLPFLAAPAEAISAAGSPERPVRGGSWLSAAGSINLETRGFLPPESCSAFVSFRPVIARKKEGR